MWPHALELHFVNADHDMPECDRTKAHGGRRLSEGAFQESATELHHARDNSDATAECQDARTYKHTEDCIGRSPKILREALDWDVHI